MVVVVSSLLQSLPLNIIGCWECFYPHKEVGINTSKHTSSIFIYKKVQMRLLFIFYATKISLLARGIPDERGYVDLCNNFEWPNGIV